MVGSLSRHSLALVKTSAEVESAGRGVNEDAYLLLVLSSTLFKLAKLLHKLLVVLLLHHF